MSTQPLGGLWPALVTPFRTDGSVAFDILERLVALFADQGLDGLYLTGSTGQWPLLTLTERRSILECVLAAAGGRLPVMVHVGAPATADAVALARHAAQCEAAAVSCVAPSYYQYSADTVFEHYRQIGSATSLPLYVYHYSNVNQLSLGARAYADRLLGLPNLAGMKITDHNLYLFGLIHSYTAGRLRLFSGADELLCHAVLSGAIGAIGTFYNLWGPSCKKARQATEAGQVAQGRAFMLRFQAAIDEVISSGSIWSFLQAAIRLKYGLDIGRPRPPLGLTEKPWTESQVQRLIAQVDTAAPEA